MSEQDKKYYLVGKAVVKGSSIIGKALIFIGFSLGWAAMIVSMFMK